ncbi:unnamed protein product [Cladocopium goreaui]|uniref:Ubiquitin-like domain-containing protein n=1 Tax=Cladocopium goreaui TaxID=2562237 RepID=A0A9P1DWY0_9DINO|nr:unnamed protein product [Cladocopium goreaui]
MVEKRNHRTETCSPGVATDGPLTRQLPVASHDFGPRVLAIAIDPRCQSTSPDPRGSEHFLDASDLGMSPDAEGYQEFLEDIGSAPPWSLSQLQGYFDRRYAGWDDPPKLSLASPVRRLQYLDEALRSDDPQSIDETLRELDGEVKNALLRSLLRDSSSDELCFLTLLVGELGAHLFDQREGRKNDRMEAERHRQQREESLLTSFQAERATLTQQMEELAAEAEGSRSELARCRAQLQAAQAEEVESSEMQLEMQELQAANRRLSMESQQLREELQELKAQKAMLLAAKEESDGALDELSRRWSNASGSLRDAEADSPPRKRASRGGQPQASLLGRLADDLSAEGRLRGALMAWRMSCLESKMKHCQTLQADLTMANGAAKGKRNCQVEGCCCQREAEWHVLKNVEDLTQR